MSATDSTPALAAACPACGAAVAEGARFCSSCGRPLQPAGVAELKLATVLFADLAGSDRLALAMDAEELRSLLADVYGELSWVAEAYGGTVEKFIGDAVMCVFGVPVAHEDDPERAIRAALVMRSRMAAVAARRNLDVRLRIGVNTGLVATGVNPRRDFLVTGEPVNLAARLQAAAEPGEVLVGERTFRGAEPAVRTVAQRSLTVKGRSGPVVAYAVERMAPARGYRRRRRPFGPFVGRSRELLLIRSLVDAVVEHGRPQLITVIGEPGIGKSRLVEEAVVELQRGADPPSVLTARCLPYGEQNPLAPLRELLLRSAAVRESDSREEARAKVRGELLALLGDGGAKDADEVLRMVASDPGPQPPDEQPTAERGRDAWHRLLHALALRRPLMLVIEDAHWAEPALLELIGGVIGGNSRVPLAVICIARDELIQQHPTWGTGARNETTITLDALDDGDMRRLATALASDDPPREAIALAGGNPFFLEEILAMAGEGVAGTVPDTVQGVIAARLDQLESGSRWVLQRAAVIGRSFDSATLEALGAGEQLGRRLRDLAERDLVVNVGGQTRAFKHALIRDVAYQSLGRAERARLHLALARHLETAGGGRHVIANHMAAAVELGRGEARGEAVAQLLAAAAEARSVHAHGSAARHAMRALELAGDDRELALAHEAAGDAHWIAEQTWEAWEDYREALERGVAADLDAATMARLRWKFTDLPTRWGAGGAGADPQVAAEIELGLADARAAGDHEREARLLISHALHIWNRHQQAGGIGVDLAPALADAELAFEIGRERDNAAISSAALDARGVVLRGLGRVAEAAATAEQRLDLVPRIPGREEQIDAYSMASAGRTATGRYREAVQVADEAGLVDTGDAGSWLSWPLFERADACFWWDRWDEALTGYERFVETWRAGTRRSRRLPSRVVGIAVAVHLLRGQRERADALERRVELDDGRWHTTAVSHALLGCGEPEQALERLPRRWVGRPWTLAIEVEAAAMLGRWDDLDRLLSEVAAGHGLEEAPRLAAQVDRARGIAGDELALGRAAAGFERLGCSFEHARCLALAGEVERALPVFERMGAEPARRLAEAR